MKTVSGIGFIRDKGGLCGWRCLIPNHGNKVTCLMEREIYFARIFQSCPSEMNFAVHFHAPQASLHL